MSFSVSLQGKKSKGKSKKSKKQGSNAFGEVNVVKDTVQLTHYSREEEIEHERLSKRRKISIGGEVKQGEVKKEAEERQDVPERVTEAEYEEMPVEEFGAAMLRGMGWNEDEEDNEEDDKKKKSRRKLPHEMLHPEGLGLGAKNDGSNDKESVKELIENFMPIKRVPKQ
ncbi:Pre-mRNA-splicing factor SPP2 [Nakaseomyces bracarensis]|uniref:Pre-mRNA-splicing factor n=1 Tax=Nakaseomyces bracarensis TaxID=273131 RepID=A0ABR4NWS2_9SACH